MRTRSIQLHIVMVLAALGALLMAAGCKPGAKKSDYVVEHRLVSPASVAGSLTPTELPRVYGTSAFVYAAPTAPGAPPTIHDDLTAPPDLALDDRRLIIISEGSGDSLEGFRYTARLLAESRQAWPLGEARPLLVLPIHWSESGEPVSQHVNYKAQKRGAVALQDLCHAHHLRRSQPSAAGVGSAAVGGGPNVAARSSTGSVTSDSLLSVMAFSAGARVVQMAFGAEVEDGQPTATVRHSALDYMTSVDHMIFVGGSLSCDDPVPFEGLRGRFVNFTNPRDTHFGDRAPYMAPAGESPLLQHVVDLRVLRRSPGFGASANGFRRLPTLTDPAQFEAADSSEAARRAFRMVNCAVPEDLVAYGLLGAQLPNDDLDDFINLAPNHYIMTGRGPGGAISGPIFAQYRERAAEFVQEFLAPALLTGRVPTLQLTVAAQPRTPLKVMGDAFALPGKAAEPTPPKPGETNPAETKPGEVQPAEDQPAETGSAPIEKPAAAPPAE